MKFLKQLVFCTLAIVVFGCSNGDRPDLGQVTGVVTIDGQPVSGLRIIFSRPGFRSSSAYTKQQGEFELKYLRDVMGAPIGSHIVRIDYMIQEGANKPKRLPEKYNRKSELTAEVKPGTNKINFDLLSQ